MTIEVSSLGPTVDHRESDRVLWRALFTGADGRRRYVQAEAATGAKEATGSHGLASGTSIVWLVATSGFEDVVATSGFDDTDAPSEAESHPAAKSPRNTARRVRASLTDKPRRSQCIRLCRECPRIHPRKR